MHVFEMRAQIGEDDIARLVETFYIRVQQEAVLGPFFARHIEADAWPAHLERMRGFWSSVLLATGRYQGNPMTVHGALPGITAQHFDRWLLLFESVANEVLVPEVAAAVVLRARRMGVRLLEFVERAGGE